MFRVKLAAFLIAATVYCCYRLLVVEVRGGAVSSSLSYFILQHNIKQIRIITIECKNMPEGCQRIKVGGPGVSSCLCTHLNVVQKSGSRGLDSPPSPCHPLLFQPPKNTDNLITGCWRYAQMLVNTIACLLTGPF